MTIFAILVIGVEYALGIQNDSLTPMPFALMGMTMAVFPVREQWREGRIGGLM